MKINDVLIKEAMIMDLEATDKEGALDEMVQRMYDIGRISNIDEYKQAILKRESETSTGLGDGIAMPHAQSSAVKQTTVLFAKSKKGIDYEALDNQPVYLFFMIAAPKNANDDHLQTLAMLARLLIDPELVNQLKAATTPEAVLTLLTQAEQEKEAEQAHEEMVSQSVQRPFIVAVTACPTGIAHTYMAEDALKKKAKELGVEIKVETNGSEGIKHRLTSEDINRAVGVIVAADKKVAMERFDGKELLMRPVNDGIRKPEQLIKDVLNGKAPIFHGSGAVESAGSYGQDSVGQRLYKDLMNGVSHMLPFVVAGGILIAISFIIDQFMGIPQTELANLGHYNQVAGWFNQIGGAAFSFMLPVLAGFIASSIGDRPGLVAGFAAGYLADQGGAGFLGALIGGFLAGYVIQGLRKGFRGLPQSLSGIKTILFYPFFGLLITGFLMLMINIPMRGLNDGLNHFLTSLSGTNAALLGFLVSAMMASDLGGPINKAAYVFGTGTLATTIATGGSVVMAAVMAGGMVPPLAIFIATRLAPRKFTQQEREAGLTNIILGLSFVTEGAIPFAAADPLRAIPSFMIGSGVTGALVGAFSLKLMAPHGGIFVALLISNPILYLFFVLIGAIVAAIILVLLKQPIESRS